jgi:uncharacterized protein (UPF0262 family)
MPVHAIRIEEGLWSSASPLRKQEWRTLTSDIVAGDPLWPSREPCTLTAGCDASHLHFVFTPGSGPAADAVALARADVAELVTEYVGVIRKLTDGDLHPAHIEALDMAKRVVHDAGGKRLGALFPDLSPSLEARRRFFSLVVSLSVDTTRFGPVPAHWGHAR